MPQSMHAPPLTPQAEPLVPGLQLEPLQQPPQVVPLQTQTPPEHACPLAQAAPVPHRQTPPELQLSEVVAEQLVQAEPELPQLPVVGGATQVFPEQQPPGQLTPSHTHTPPEHRWPAPQGAPVPHLQLPPLQLFAREVLHDVQAAPPLPHAEVVGGEVQVDPLQHPLGQLTALQP